MNSYFDDIINYIEDFSITLSDINIFFSNPEYQYKLLDFNDKKTNLYRLTEYYLQKDAHYDIDDEEDIAEEDVAEEDVAIYNENYSENQLDEILFDDDDDDLLDEINLNNISVYQSNNEEEAEEVEEAEEDDKEEAEEDDKESILVDFSCDEYCDEYCICKDDEDDEDDEDDAYDYIDDYCRININYANTVITVSYKLLLFLKVLIDVGLYDFIEKNKENILIEMNNSNNIKQLNKLNFFSLYI
jgi:hypothetical protein